MDLEEDFNWADEDCFLLTQEQINHNKSVGFSQD